jgi:hypothetical protein
MDIELEQYYKNKIAKLEEEIRSLKGEYESEHKVQEQMSEQIYAQKRIIEKREAVIKKYIDKYGLLTE